MTIREQILQAGREAKALLAQRAAQRLAHAGEAAVERARASDGYQNRTGLLRSSVNWAVSASGSVVAEGSPMSFGPMGGQGAALASQALSKLAAQSAGLALHIVAAAPYARDVEMGQGRDVLASARIEAERRLK